jgi:hypothetical protein
LHQTKDSPFYGVTVQANNLDPDRQANTAIIRLNSCSQNSIEAEMPARLLAFGNSSYWNNTCRQVHKIGQQTR